MTPDTINLIQEFNQHVLGMSKAICPFLEAYPETLDVFQLPLTLTEFERTWFWGQGDTKYALGDCVVRMIFAQFGEGELGWIKIEVSDFQTNFQERYLDPDAYLVKGQFVLQKEPVRIEIVRSEQMFDMSGYKIIEYPEMSGMAFHGFELRFQVRETWSVDCVRSVS